MTRGRRKDLTIPPSRALLQQRDYRARKAQYLADLEERVRRAEGENVELKQEVDQLKSRLRQENGGPSTYAQELVSPFRRSSCPPHAKLPFPLSIA